MGVSHIRVEGPTKRFPWLLGIGSYWRPAEPPDSPRKRPLCWRRRSFAVSLGGVDAVETARRAGGAVPDGLGSRRELGGAARRGSSS